MESNFIEQLLSTDNQVRSTAEKAIYSMKETNPSSLALNLVENMKSDKPEVA